MKCDIKANGLMMITSESNIESYALQKWWGENGDKISKGDIECYFNTESEDRT